jgi:methionine-rich copper-binding protein CopC
MKRLLAAVTAMLVVVLAPGVPAWAHATLVSADPAKDLVLGVAPTTVTLEFNERLNPDFTTIVVSDPARQRVAAAPATVDDVRGSITLTGALGNGVYTVAYRVVSVDGHTVQGSYPFTLADPNLPPAPVQVSPAAAPAPAADEDGSIVVPAVAGAGVLVLIGAAIWLLLSRRRPGN